MQYTYGAPLQVKHPGDWRRTLRNIAISGLTLVIMLLAAGFLYALLSERNIPALPASRPSAPPFLKPTPPGLTAPEQAAVQSLTSPVATDSDASVSVKTNATSTCKIALSYTGAPSSSALGVHGTDDYGDVTWTWHIAKDAPLGSWPVTVTCIYLGRSAVVAQNMQIISAASR